MKIICWNVNGVRAVMKKGFLEFMEKEDADVFCIQGSKIKPEQLTQELMNPLGYFSEWASAERAGYSGVATFSKIKAAHVQKEMGGDPRSDNEGRFLLTEFGGVTLINTYIPNGGQGDHRIQFKLDYYDELFDLMQSLRKEGKNIVLCGDINTAHQEMDLARPKQNEKTTGFLPV